MVPKYMAGKGQFSFFKDAFGVMYKNRSNATMDAAPNCF